MTAGAQSGQLTFAQLEDQINMWLEEMNNLETGFHNQAAQVNAWDMLLVNNGAKITALMETIEKLKTELSRLDHQVDFISSQQRELETQVIEPLEKMKLESESQGGGLDPATREREFTYALVETVDNDLQMIGTDLKDFIKKINENKAISDPASDPLNQIGKILNAHMDALNWIDTQVRVLNDNVKNVASN